jgi:hypothetical protein
MRPSLKRPSLKRPSLKGARGRASDRARQAAAGGDPPAGREAPPPPAVAGPGAVERGTMRRRLRRARRLRIALLTELGALVMEMRRQGREDPALVDRKAREALALDAEVTGLSRALGTGQTVDQVVAAGIAGSCRACGALLGTDDRFCARCGTPAAPVRDGRAAAAAPPPDPGTRVAAPAAPPPDPGTRVPAPGGQDPAAPITTGTARQ